MSIYPDSRTMFLLFKLSSKIIRSAPEELYAAATALRKDTLVPLLTPSFLSSTAVTTKVLM